MRRINHYWNCENNSNSKREDNKSDISCLQKKRELSNKKNSTSQQRKKLLFLSTEIKRHPL